MTALLINEDSRTVRLNGEDVPLGARAFDVLVYLMQNADHVVSKEDLLNHVWAGTLVEESNLTVQIAGLRKALGKDAIKTVPGVGYKFTLNASAPVDTTPSASPPELPTIPSLAVLPFANLTGDEANGYIVDGIVNEITTALARVSSIFVISNTSTYTYRGKVVDLTEVGRDLGVRYILEGSIQKAGDRLRIFTQLVEAKTARMIWHNKCEGSSVDIFELQDTVAECVAAAIEPKLIWAEAARARAKPTDSLKAYDLCMKAAPLAMRQTSLADLEESLDLLGQTLALDPNYIQAKALVCLAHTGSFASRWWSFEKAQAALPLAQEVLDSNTDDPLSLAFAGHYIAYIGKEPQKGLTALQQANMLNPNSATIAMLLGWVHNYLDENEEAIEHLRRALRISPLHPQIGVITSGIGNSMFQKGAFDEALKRYQLALTQLPEFASAHIGLMAIYWKLGILDKSAEMAEFLRHKVPDMTIATFLRTHPQTSTLYCDTVTDALRTNGFPED